jgi:DNA-binding response OmpR family regulator
MPERPDVWTALVVDDDPGLGGAVRDVLAGLDCRAVVAASYDEAVTTFRTVPAHFSILDVHVRDRTGFDILRELRLVRADHPAIFMSGAFTDEILRRADSVGAFSLLAKPLNLGRLRDAVGGLLGSGRLSRN